MELLFELEQTRPALVADGLAEIQVRWPNIPIIFCETRQLAEEWTYRFLAAAHAWADTDTASIMRLAPWSRRSPQLSWLERPGYGALHPGPVRPRPAGAPG